MSRPRRGLWRHHDFLKLWAGQATSLFGSFVGSFAFDLAAILTLHASPAQIAVLNGCLLVPGLLAGPWIGLWADRVRRRPLLIGADLGRALLLLSVPLAAVSGRLTLLQLDGVAAAGSVLTVLFDVSYRAYLPALVGTDHIIEANSRLQATEAVTEASGWGIAGILVQLFTAPIVVAIDALSFVISALSLLTLRTEVRVAPHSADPHWWRDIREGAAAIRRDGILFALATTTFAWDLAGNVIGVVIVLFFVREMHVPPAFLGPLFGFGGISALLGALLAQRLARRFPLGRLLVGSVWFDMVGLLPVLILFGPFSLPITLLMAATGQASDGGRSIYTVHSTSLLQSRVPDRVAGRVNAAFTTISSIAMVLGLIAGGYLGATIGIRGTLLVAVIADLFVPLCLVFSPVRTLGTRRGESVAAWLHEAGPTR